MISIISSALCSRKTSIFLLLFALIIMCNGMGGCVSSFRPNSIVIARVNDFQITRDDLVEELRQFHLYQTRSGQAGELDISSFLNDMIDRRLFIQEARRMGLDQTPGFQKALSDEREEICLQVLREEKIIKPCGPLTQGDIDSYYHELGQAPPRLSEMSRFESQSVTIWKEVHFSHVYIQGLKQRSKIEIFEQKLAEASSRAKVSSRDDSMKLQNDPDPVARVNGEEIRGQDLYEEIKGKLTRVKEKDDAGQVALFIKDGLNRLIEYWLLRQEAFQRGYLKRKDVRKRLQRREDDLLYRTVLQNAISPKVKVNSEEIERYYQDNLSSFQSETMVYLEQIVVEDPNSAQQIYRELLQGADFSFLASQKAVKSEGVPPERGKWVSLQKMQPELRSLLSPSGLKEGQIIPPVKFGIEYSIFRIREKKGGEQIPLEKVKVRIEKEIASRKFHSIAQDCLQRLRTASKIFIDENNVQRMTSVH